MRSLSGHPATTLTWRRRAPGPPDYELREDGPSGAVFATLALLDEDRTLARVETAEGTWTLKHRGLLIPSVTLREEGERTNLATFHPHALRHGKLQFLDGATFDWRWSHEDLPGGEFLDPGGRPLVRLHPSPGPDLRMPPDLERCDVDLDATVHARFRHALLAAFGWYLLLFDHLKARDEAAAAMALRL